MWKNILIFVFLGSLVFTPPSFCQENTGNIDARFVGTWEAKAGGARIVTTIKQDGTWISEGYCPYKESPDITTGSWEVKDNKFLWTYDKDNILFRAGEKDINPILGVTNEKFILKEMSGIITTFKRIGGKKNVEK